MKHALFFLTILIISICPTEHILGITCVSESVETKNQSIQVASKELASPYTTKPTYHTQQERLRKKVAKVEKGLTRKISKKGKGPKRPKKPNATETTAIVAFATGVGGLLLMIATLTTFLLPGFFFLAGMASCVVGIVFGAISLKRFKNGLNDGRGKGLALAGMIVGIVAIAAILAIVIAFILTF